MLIKAKKLNGFKLQSKDEEFGKVKEFYFDDDYWTIRYLIAETGNWLIGNQVLLSPHALDTINAEEKYINVNLTKKQIEESPPLKSNKPVSRQFEERYMGYYGWPKYWVGPYMWGSYPHIGFTGVDLPMPTREPIKSDAHLRSTHDVRRYNIHAIDGELGHVDDFVIDDKTWEIRYMVIDTKNWIPGKKILVSPRWIKSISWVDSEVKINLHKETIKNAPEYTEETNLNKDYEDRLLKYYNIEK